MQIVIDIPNAPIKDYQDLYYKIHGMAASEGLFDDKEKSQRALALKAVLDVLGGVVNGTPLPKGHGRLGDLDALEILCIEHEIANSALDNSPMIEQGHYSDGDCIWKPLFDFAPTIIEADAESEDKG